MAGHTSNPGVFVSPARVAFRTLDRCVFPQQRKAGKPMIELRHLPGSIVVALLALFAFLAFMLVVFLVTVKTIQRRFSETAKVFMAGLALDGSFCVRVAQDKFGAIMIKTTRGGLPIFLAVTVTAFLTQCRVVLVVLLMASQTFLGRLLVHGALVTLLACGLDVLSEQRETGSRMVKFW